MRPRFALAFVLTALVTAAAPAQDAIDVKSTEAAVKSGSATRDQQLALARHYISSGRFYEASKITNALTAADENDREAMTLREQAMTGLREANQKLVADAEAAARRSDATDADRLALANAYFDAGNYDLASEMYAKLPADAMAGDARLRHARALSWSGRFDAAERTYSALLRESSTPELELEYGRLLSWMGATSAANERLRRIYDTQHTEDSALALANSLAWSGDRDMAIRVLTDYTNANPNATQARNALATFRTSPELRIERLEKLIALEPHNLALRVERARMLLAAGRYSESLREIRFAREHATEDIDGLADLETRVKQAREAERVRIAEELRGVNRRDVQDADQMLSLAKAYTAIDDYDQAIALYEDYLRLRPADEKARVNYARVLSWDRRWSAAEQEYERILAANPDRADLRLELAQIVSYDADYARAVPMFSSLTDISDNPRAHLYSDVPSRAHYNLGQIYRWYGWNETAVEHQNRAIALDGGYIPAREELDLVRHVRPASALDARYSYATDSNDFTLRRVDLEGELWRNQRNAIQASIGRHNFEHQGTEISANAASLGLIHRYNDRWMFRGRAGATFYEEDLGTRPFFGVGAQWLPNLQSRAAIDFNHYDLVYDVFTLASLSTNPVSPTVNFNDPISINDVRAHYDYNSGRLWALLGDVSYGVISDDNSRTAAHGIVSFRLWRDPFIAIKADGRYLSYDFRTNRYWSPDDYNSLAGVLQIGQNVRDRFFWSVEGKLGKAWEGNRESDLRSVSARVTVPVTDLFDVVGNYGYGRSGRFESVLGDQGTDFTNYWQRYWSVGVRIKRLHGRDDRRAENPYYYDNRVLAGSPVASPVGETR
ncbi:MAG TPA: tetratricopeptide repeat protein [Thermoanaerobaculia bacterium]